MNKIFLNNFPQNAQSVQTNDKDIRLIAGFETKRDSSEIKKNLIKDTFNSLLIHDKICLRIRDFGIVVDSFGLYDTLTLLKNDYIELIDDEGLKLPIVVSKGKYEGVAVFDSTQETNERRASINWFEEQLFKYYPKDATTNKLILLNCERTRKVFNTNLVSDLILKETNYDLGNKNITNNLRISSPNRNNIHEKDALSILRLMHLNLGLIYSLQSECTNTLSDGAIKQIMNYKLSPAAQLNKTDSIELLKDITNHKGIPDLSELYLNKTIALQDFINIRENFNGRKFRDWFYDTGYNQNEVLDILMSNNDKLNAPLIKTIRFLVTNVVGLFNPFAGLATAAADSYVIDKVFKGWHPNFFLDNILKSEIDKKIKDYEKEKKLSKIKTKFPKIGRNDPCPCRSGKKFKKCCGR